MASINADRPFGPQGQPFEGKRGRRTVGPKETGGFGQNQLEVEGVFGGGAPI